MCHWPPVTHQQSFLMSTFCHPASSLYEYFEFGVLSHHRNHHHRLLLSLPSLKLSLPLCSRQLPIIPPPAASSGTSVSCCRLCGISRHISSPFIVIHLLISSSDHHSTASAVLDTDRHSWCAIIIVHGSNSSSGILSSAIVILIVCMPTERLVEVAIFVFVRALLLDSQEERRERIAFLSSLGRFTRTTNVFFQLATRRFNRF